MMLCTLKQFRNSKSGLFIDVVILVSVVVVVVVTDHLVSCSVAGDSGS